MSNEDLCTYCGLDFNIPAIYHVLCTHKDMIKWRKAFIGFHNDLFEGDSKHTESKGMLPLEI